MKAGDITPKAHPPVKIDHLSPAQVEADLAIVLDGNVEDPGAVVAKITLYYRAGSSGTFQTAPVTYSTRRFRVEIPAATVQPPLIEYYLEAVDDKGLPRANRGDATAPLRIAVPDEGGSVLTSPWFWVPTGLVVVGAAVAIAVVVATTGDGEPPTSTVSVNVFE